MFIVKPDTEMWLVDHTCLTKRKRIQVAYVSYYLGY